MHQHHIIFYNYYHCLVRTAEYTEYKNFILNTSFNILSYKQRIISLCLTSVNRLIEMIDCSFDLIQIFKNLIHVALIYHYCE